MAARYGAKLVEGDLTVELEQRSYRVYHPGHVAPSKDRDVLGLEVRLYRGDYGPAAPLACLELDGRAGVWKLVAGNASPSSPGTCSGCFG